VEEEEEEELYPLTTQSVGVVCLIAVIFPSQRPLKTMLLA
jgi:hypothetical protein